MNEQDRHLVKSAVDRIEIILEDVTRIRGDVHTISCIITFCFVMSIILGLAMLFFFLSF